MTTTSQRYGTSYYQLRFFQFLTLILAVLLAREWLT